VLIKNGTLLNGEFRFMEADVLIEGETITEICKIGGAPDIDASGCYIIPGLIDTHIHGAMGKTYIDFDNDTSQMIAEFEAKHGTTSIVPALSAAPKEKLLKCIEYIKQCFSKDNENGAKMYGFHLEGPFFSPKYKGAHLPENIRNADPDELMEYIHASNGLLKIITLAPELPNGGETIKKAVENDVCVSIGHSDATYDRTCHAIALGARQGTHLFNAMRPMNHRDPGVVGGILFTDAKTELICDFFHVHKDVIKMVYDMKGSDRINMVTDAEVGTGLPDGVYEVNGRWLCVTGGKTYTEDGTIAGGTSCLIDGIRNLVSIGIPLEDACKMASKNPAETVGIYDKVGSLEKGKIADVVVLDKRELSVKHVIVRGKLLF